MSEWVKPSGFHDPASSGPLSASWARIVRDDIAWLSRRPTAVAIARADDDYTPAGIAASGYTSLPAATYPRFALTDTHGFNTRGTSLRVPAGLDGVYLVTAQVEFDWDSATGAATTTSTDYGSLGLYVNYGTATYTFDGSVGGNSTRLDKGSTSTGVSAQQTLHLTAVTKLQAGDVVEVRYRFLINSPGDGYQTPSDENALESQFSLRWLSDG